MNKLFWLLLFGLLGTVPMDAQQSPDARQGSYTRQPRIARDRIDSLFSPWNNANSPGAALGIIRNGELIYEQGYGMADLEDHIKISPATVFNIASISKQFTAASILLLQQQKKLSLNDDVRHYIPELPDYGQRISIRQLLDHTSGIRDYIQLMFLAGLRYNSKVGTKDGLNMIMRQKALNFKPGDEWLYSNSGYILASLIVERVSGKTLADFEREHIFLPLGMKHTGFTGGTGSPPPGFAIGYEPDSAGLFRKLISNWGARGDGGICTTLEDLLLWDRNFYYPKVGGQAMINELIKPGSLNDHTILQYSLGLGIGTYQGLKIVEHGGEWAGYRAEFMRFPEERFSVIVFCNLSSMVPLRLAQQVSEICLGDKMKKVQQEGRSTALAGTLSMDSTQLSRFSGYFRSPSDELVREIRVRDGKLLYIRGQGSISELAPIGSDRFRMMGVPTETSVVFSSSASGQVTGFSVVTPNIKSVIFESFAPYVATPDLLAPYCGIYHSEELNKDYKVTMRDSFLYMKTDSSGDDLLSPTARDVFKMGSVGIVRFRRDKEDAVEGFSFTFGRVRNLAFARSIETSGNKDAGNLPYHEIPAYPGSFTAGNAIARIVDGLGFRYYWATSGLRDIDLAFKPSKEGRTTLETIIHIYDLSEMILNAAKKLPDPPDFQKGKLSFSEMRTKTLQNFKAGSDQLKATKEEELSDCKVRLPGETGNSEYPFWNLLNGPIDDALTHVGQVVSFRRSSGNPVNPKANVLTGRMDQ